MNLTTFPGKPQSWKITGPAENSSITDTAVELEWNTPAYSTVTRSLPIDPVAAEGSPLVRLGGRIERLGGAASDRSLAWQARFLITYRRAGEVLQYGAVTGVNGQYTHQHFEYLVQPPAGSDAIELHWQLRSAGHWRLTGLDVSAVSINSHYHYAAAGLIACWSLYLGWLAMVVVRSASRASMLAMLASVCVIVAGTGMGQPTMTSLVQPVVSLFWSWYPGEHVPGVQSLLKAGHVAAFMLLTGLLLKLRRSLALSVAGSLLLCLTLAAASESLQRHRFNRSPELRDVLIDSIGIALALSCFVLWRWFRSRRERASCTASAVPVSRT